MDFLSLTQSNWFLVGPVAKVLGVVMNGIYEFLDMFGIASIGLAIILFTIIIKALMLPLPFKQQKFTKLNSIMAPELQQVQKKYANLDKSSPKYNEMLLKQNEEMKEVYAKYGTSPTGGCVQMLIQMPILLALYQVIYHIPGYIGSVRNVFQGLTTQMMGVSGYSDILTQFITDNRVTMYSKVSETLTENNLLDMFYVLKPSQWTKLADISEFSGIADTITKTAAESNRISTCSLDLISHSLR